MELKTISINLLLLIILCSIILTPSSSSSSSSSSRPYRGKWKYLKRNLGISAMHIALLPTNKIIAFDWTNGASNITLLKCPPNVQECSAHSVEFDLVTRKTRPLTILSDTWCSSGALSPDGVLVQTGGFVLGDRVVRYLKPCHGCDWREDRNGLLKPRWYATNQVLPDGRSIVVGGLSQFSYEFVPRMEAEDSVVRQFPFLKETMTSLSENNNLYPFVHLTPDGNLFIFANDRAVLLDYVRNQILRKYPVFPGGFSHNYPSTGSSVLLPLILNGPMEDLTVEVLICGGTYPTAFQNSMSKTRRNFIPASKLCGRLTITDQSPAWKIEKMPIRRIMGDMILLPTGDVLIVNGAAKGAAGWDNARSPVTNPVLYRLNVSDEERFEVLVGSETPRLYHSSAHLLPDGRVLVGGSNPNNRYNFTTQFPTELSLEAFYPPYLTTGKPRPEITSLNPGVKLVHNEKISLGFRLSSNEVLANDDDTYLTMVAPSFTTHSLSMHQRVLVLKLDEVRQTSIINGEYVVDGETPATSALAPPGYYLLFLVHDGIPSRGKWVQIE